LRKLVRLSQPQHLEANASDWTATFVAGRAADPKFAFNWRSQTCYREIKQQLLQITQGHCAYCDGPLGTESRETVDHFRPKAQFPDLAYDWDNLFPCCDKCQSVKREQFDAALLKPDDPDYFFEHYFLVNYKTGELASLPDANVYPAVQVTLQIFGLNSPSRNKARIREREQFDRDPSPILDDYNYRFFLL
jgi:uncharacterized protein (TIGR02646 family)